MKESHVASPRREEVIDCSQKESDLFLISFPPLLPDID
jgi:hypothetical protein